MFYKVSVSFHMDYIEVKGDQIKIGVMVRPQRGEANAEIIKKIANYFQVHRSNVRLVSGQKSRNKIVQVTRQVD
ncbi:MAG: DUF167 domain-containing protein [Nitrosotalea sp.]